MKHPCVYILASQRNGTLYTGVTSDLIKRVWEHKNDLIEGFTNKYGVHRLVYFEQHEDMNGAITREKQIKKYQTRETADLFMALIMHLLKHPYPEELMACLSIDKRGKA
jgi:putative endonuclease